MTVSEKTMKEIVQIMDEEIGVTFPIEALADILTRSKAQCEETGADEKALPCVVAAELRKYKAAHKMFGFGRMKYAALFENPGAPAGAIGT